MMDFQAEAPPHSSVYAPQMHSPRWYVAYTYPRHERSVADQLAQKSVETFLPTYSKVNRWKDRRVTLEVPLFPSYVFTRMHISERAAVLALPGVIRLVSFQGSPVPVEDGEIDSIRLCIAKGGTMLPHRLIAVGDRVRVREGAFEGLEGVMVRHNNNCSLVVTISLIQQSVALEIEANRLEVLRVPQKLAS